LLKNRLSRNNAYIAAFQRAFDFKFEHARHFGKQRVVFTHPYAVTGMKLRATLANNDIRLLCESRPLRLEPPAFLCAMSLLSS